MAGNVLGSLGIVAVATAVGGLTGNWWWMLLVLGVALCLAAYAAYTYAAGVELAERDQVADAGAASSPPADGEAPLRAVRS